MVARLNEIYNGEIREGLREHFGYANPMRIPRLQKIVISMGIGDAQTNTQKMEEAQKQLTMIAGQKPVVMRAKRAVSNFRLREGMQVGLKVTLRGQRMYEFLDRLVSLAIPRVKDFRGLNPSSFDGRGNYNMGLVEQTVFPEIDPAAVQNVLGMNIAFQTSAETDEEALELLKRFGMPFRQDD